MAAAAGKVPQSNVGAYQPQGILPLSAKIEPFSDFSLIQYKQSIGRCLSFETNKLLVFRYSKKINTPTGQFRRRKFCKNALCGRCTTRTAAAVNRKRSFSGKRCKPALRLVFLACVLAWSLQSKRESVNSERARARGVRVNGVARFWGGLFGCKLA